MINKSYRPTREDAVGVQKLIEKDPRIEKGQSEALYYAFKDAAEDIPDWAEIAKVKFEEDTDVEIEPDYSNTRTFMVDENDFEVVVDSFKSQLNIQKVRISYMTRLCILAARVRMGKEIAEEKKAVSVENVDGVELLRKVNDKAAELIKKGDLSKIYEFLEV